MKISKIIVLDYSKVDVSKSLCTRIVGVGWRISKSKMSINDLINGVYSATTHGYEVPDDVMRRVLYVLIEDENIVIQYYLANKLVTHNEFVIETIQ